MFEKKTVNFNDFKKPALDPDRIPRTTRMGRHPEKKLQILFVSYCVVKIHISTEILMLNF